MGSFGGRGGCGAFTCRLSWQTAQGGSRGAGEWAERVRAHCIPCTLAAVLSYTLVGELGGVVREHLGSTSWT